jgi:hypothetical protein
MKISKRQLRDIIRKEKLKVLAENKVRSAVRRKLQESYMIPLYPLEENLIDDFFEDPAVQVDRAAAQWIMDMVHKRPGTYTLTDLERDMYQDGFTRIRVQQQVKKLVDAGELQQAPDGSLS